MARTQGLDGSVLAITALASCGAGFTFYKVIKWLVEQEVKEEKRRLAEEKQRFYDWMLSIPDRLRANRLDHTAPNLDATAD
ncbi:hypothetical protein ABBQ38_011372 [Trebouxia sp. C0009 RCD-2024]